MPVRGKTKELIQTLERRIRHGDYAGVELPSERALSDEFNVTRMTARNAVIRLIDAGLLKRQPNRRVVVSNSPEGMRGPVGFLVPSMTSPVIESWRLRITEIAEEFGSNVRTVMYAHWGDPVIAETLDGFEGVFLCPASEHLPERVAALLRKHSRSLIAVEQDMTSLGIRSVMPFSNTAYHQLFDVLAHLGHRHIDCFNVQPIDQVIESRILQWNLWRSAQCLKGRVIGDPDRGYDLPIERARVELGDLLDAGQIRSTAIVCTTMPAAVGAIRAMADRGMVAGRDLSVCCFNDESFAKFTVPSITSLCEPDLRPMIRLCLEWMFNDNGQWFGPMALSTDKIDLFEGESTGPPPTNAG